MFARKNQLPLRILSPEWFPGEVTSVDTAVYCTAGGGRTASGPDAGTSCLVKVG